MGRTLCNAEVRLRHQLFWTGRIEHFLGRAKLRWFARSGLLIARNRHRFHGVYLPHEVWKVEHKSEIRTKVEIVKYWGYR